jgi:hypothetical protein
MKITTLIVTLSLFVSQASFARDFRRHPGVPLVVAAAVVGVATYAVLSHPRPTMIVIQPRPYTFTSTVVGAPAYTSDMAYNSWVQSCNNFRMTLAQQNNGRLISVNCGMPVINQDPSSLVLTETSVASYSVLN